MRVLGLILLVAGLAMAQGVDQSWQAPREASAKKNPLAAKPELAAGGEKVFTRMCKVCHASGSEQQKGPHLDSPAVQAETDGALFWKISNGNTRSGMPSFSNLPEGQRWQLVLYIRSLAHPK